MALSGHFVSKPNQDIRPLDLTTVPAHGAAPSHRLPYTAAADDARAVSQASVCSRVRQGVLESRRAYLIQAIKVNEITRERLLVMGTGMAAKEFIARVKQAHICNALSKWNTNLVVEKRVGIELVNELGSVQKMVRRYKTNAAAFDTSFSRSICTQVTSGCAGKAGNGSNA
ncbi:hypothetical protein EST38_g11222 [Candolleomyces aberdarensis]|uniref:Uncharacterized protein n=1 Tax=Candolleomyces aberdarensis TaxID=2316362 RepID=A0A4Q2D7P1_9AGAR|nr:hypothetical protein EST38_g11222 [Candolleomyces aberdarensis]